MPQVPYVPEQAPVIDKDTLHATRPWVGWFQFFAQLFRGDTNGAIVKWGTNSPEGVVTAVVGSVFLRTDGGAVTTLYIKTSGTGSAGWTAK